MITIREINIDDAEALLGLSKQVDAETDFMLKEAGERKTTVEEQKEFIKSCPLRGHYILVATDKEILVGFCIALAQGVKKCRYTRNLVIGILQSHIGRGLGKDLFCKMENWARQNKIHRLDIKVMSHNDRAIGLYKKMGFNIEGTRQHAIFQNDQYYDLLQMAKLLE